MGEGLKRAFAAAKATREPDILQRLAVWRDATNAGVRSEVKSLAADAHAEITRLRRELAAKKP